MTNMNVNNFAPQLFIDCEEEAQVITLNLQMTSECLKWDELNFKLHYPTQTSVKKITNINIVSIRQQTGP